MGQIRDRQAGLHQEPAERGIVKMLKRRLSMDHEQPTMPKPVKLKGHPGMDSLEENP